MRRLQGASGRGRGGSEAGKRRVVVRTDGGRKRLRNKTDFRFESFWRRRREPLVQITIGILDKLMPNNSN